MNRWISIPLLKKNAALTTKLSSMNNKKAIKHKIQPMKTEKKKKTVESPLKRKFFQGYFHLFV